jgi:restriction system-associated AAA family ATPase
VAGTKPKQGMKLRHFQINSEFRGLPKGFYLNFRQNNYYAGDNEEPICMVGLNGSGKSNSLEVLSELFYYLELKTLATEKTLEAVDKRYAFLDFVLSYEISSFKWKNTFNRTNARLPFSPEAKVLITCTKKANADLQISVFDLDQNKPGYPAPHYLWREILPSKVVGYSSGQNELISNPFIKLDYYYFEEFVKSTSEANVEINTEVNRMFFMDYESNELIVLANYLFAEEGQKNQQSDVNTKLGIEALHSFSLIIRYRNYSGNVIEFPSELNLGIEKLKQCATAWNDDKGKTKRDRVITLSYYTDVAVRKAFRKVFKTPYELFRLLYLMRLMNIHSISPSARKKIREADQGTNLSDLIPRPEQESLVFKVSGIRFRKKNVKEPVWYKQLSDGEHQLLHIMGTLKIMRENDVLFLLDEPETHFNPEWRAKMIRLIMETNQEEGLEQDHFITSHSPFIISDCKPTNVYLFHRKDGKLQVPVQTAHDRRLNTFGTSVNLLTDEVFNKNESQGEYAGITIAELMKREYTTQAEIEKAKEDARVLGDSVEKTLLFRKLMMLEDELKAKKKGEGR